MAKCKATGGVEATPNANSLGAPIAIMGIPIDHLNRSQALTQIEQMIASHRPNYIATADVDLLIQARNNLELRRTLFDAAMVLCNGSPLLWASRTLGDPLPDRVSSSDLVPLLLELADEQSYRIFILGSDENANRQVTEQIRLLHPNVQIAGCYSLAPTEFAQLDSNEIQEQILEAQPDILVVALRGTENEMWIAKHYRSLGVPVSVNIGTMDLAALNDHRSTTGMMSAIFERSRRIAIQSRRFIRDCMKDFLIFAAESLRQSWQAIWQRSDPASVPTAAQEMTGSRHIVLMPERLDASAVQEDGNRWEGEIRDATVVVDLSATTFLDSTGMGLLMRLQRLAREREVPFALARLTPKVSRNLASMKLTGFFPLGDTIENAIAVALRSHRRSLGLRETPTGIALQMQGNITATNAEQSFSHCAELLKGIHLDEAAELDLSGVTFVDKSGLAVLVRLRRLAQRLGIHLRVTNPTPAVSTTLRVSKLAEYLLIDATCTSV